MQNSTYQLTINSKVHHLSLSDLQKSEILEISADNFNFILNNQSINLKVIAADYINSNYKIEVEGEIFDIKIKNPLEQELEKLGFDTIQSKKITNIKAPMPGLVLDICVEEGDMVNEGDILVILEAMKMENSIKIAAEAQIGKILISKGNAVEKGEIMIELI